MDGASPTKHRATNGVDDAPPSLEWPASRVRDTFVGFFEKRKQHRMIPSSAVVPLDDPTLLFTNAGMNQFKPVFLGQVDSNSPFATIKRACNTQKCIRAGGKHNDLDDVGKDTYHHTFFEMLGNWSFGDYFKKEAINWAYELLVNVYGLNPDRMYATYYEGNEQLGLPADDEARALWRQYLPAERILPFGAKDNFWEMGDVGPCGPCSEVHYDRVGGRDAAALVNADDPEVIEIWNLVFIQFNREADGSLRALPSRHVDTGLGFERLTSILQSKFSNYDTDVFAPLFDAIQSTVGCRAYTGKLGMEDKDGVDTAYRVVADHIRTLSVAIADGAVPSAEGRGYVLRRILRRAVRYGQQFMNGREGFFSALVAPLVDQLGGTFPELRTQRDRIHSIVHEEELAFGRTLENGIARFNKMAEALHRRREKTIPGEEAFFLYSTMGFPLDLTQLMAEEKGLQVDVAAYDDAMERAKLISRQDRASRAGGVDRVLVLEAEETDRLRRSGVAPTDDAQKYEWDVRPRAHVRAIFVGDKREPFVDSTAELAAGGDGGGSGGAQTVGVVLDATSFYAESGGQVCDRGELIVGASPTDGEGGDDEAANTPTRFDVVSCQSFGGFVLHIGRVADGGVLRAGDRVTCAVDYARRRRVAPNHTMTHVLNFALRKVLGVGADQRGSLVDEDKLRFDFAHGQAVSLPQALQVEWMSRRMVGDALPVYSKVVPLADAKAIHSLRAVFGEVYPDPVRVVSVGREVEAMVRDPLNEAWSAVSVELCGGTHLRNTAEAGDFALVEEGGIAKGIRRMVALTGDAATKSYEHAALLRRRLERCGASPADDEHLQAELTQLGQEIDAAALSLPLKHDMRTQLAQLSAKARKATKERASKAQALAEEEGVRLAAEAAEDGREFVVAELPLGVDAKLSTKLAGLMLAKMAGGSVLVVSSDAEKERLLAVAASSDAHVKRGLSAADWVKAATQGVGGKGGGKPATAQAQAKAPASEAASVAAAASAFASEKLR